MKEDMIVWGLACIGELRNTQRILARKPEGKGLLGRCKCKKVRQSLYRPGQAQRVLRKLRFSDFVTMVQDGGKVVSLTPLPPGNTPGTHF